jgi:hypothetical protein
MCRRRLPIELTTINQRWADFEKLEEENIDEELSTFMRKD